MTLGRGKVSQLATLSHIFLIFNDLIDCQFVCFVREEFPPIADTALGCFSGVPLPILEVLSKVVVDMFFLDCIPSLGKLSFAGSFPPIPSFTDMMLMPIENNVCTANIQLGV